MNVDSRTITQPRDAGAICDQLDSFFENFREEFKQITGIDTDIDGPTVQNISVSFTHDVERYKAYHQTELPDGPRRAAYMCKWLTRLRPVRVVSPYNPATGAHYMMVNEHFALYVVSGILQIDLESCLNTRMLTTLLYSMRYRASTEDTFILYFASICNLE